MAATALRAYREAFRQLETHADKNLAELPSFRSELMKAKEYNVASSVSSSDVEIDWNTIHRQLPHHTQAINAVQKFYNARRDSINAAPDAITPKVHMAVMEKLREAEKMAAYARVPLNRIAKELAERKEALQEKERFLIEEKVDNLLKRNPEWAALIQDQLANLKYFDPQRGSHFQEDA